MSEENKKGGRLGVKLSLASHGCLLDGIGRRCFGWYYAKNSKSEIAMATNSMYSSFCLVVLLASAQQNNKSEIAIDI